jgi:prepilin-type N-terminal cleavage/methylation domain-containing protein/prepilin-type processing-associated H-X9-DG protein
VKTPDPKTARRASAGLSTSPLSRASKAFSLIELLVSIAVLAVLASILLTALSAVRSSTSATKCSSNLRQLQLANITYANSNPNRRYVPVFINGSESASQGRTIWHSNEDFAQLCGITQQIESMTDVKNAWPKSLICPSATIDGGRIDRTYAYNRTSLTGYYSAPGAVVAASAFDIIHPDRVIAFIDAVNWMIDYNAGGGIGEYVGEVTSNNTVAFRHKDMANAVFFDGHVEALTEEQVTENPAIWMIHE